MHGEREQKAKMAAEINDGLRNRKFFLHYQAWVDAQAGTIAGIEVLPRWLAPGGEIRHPRHYQAIAEESGVILKITRQLLADAAKQWQQWQRESLRVGVLAYNVTARELRDSLFLRELGAVLLERGMKAEDTQINLLGDPGSLQKGGQFLSQRIGELRELGFRVMLDRFSGDAVSLAALATMPVNALRLDPELVIALGGAAAADTSARIARILDTAAEHRVTVIAPEVDDRGQYQQLLALGCRYMQGYLFARPGDAQFAERALREVTPR
jgi:EAL domain-containing protein (putative c-di-GMP-specific phosphodiesterase class I)